MWSQQHRSLTVVAISALALSNALLLSGFIVTLRVTPQQVLREVQEVKTELKITTETTRAAIGANAKRIAELQAQMKTRTEQLRRANEALLKLDPNFKVEMPDPYAVE